MEIPVFGLSGTPVQAAAARSDSRGARGWAAGARVPGTPFKRYAAGIKNPALRQKITERHVEELNGLAGVFEWTLEKINNNAATEQDVQEFRKAQILLTLEGMDYNAYRLASIYMPYVSGIDAESGAYIFPSAELAAIAAAGEEELIAYEKSPSYNEAALQGFLKKIGNALSNAAKSVGNAVTAAAKSTVNAVKATGNLVKAGAQAITGKGSAAKETLNKAAQQAKAAVVNPIKTAVSDTKTVVKDAIDVTKETVKIAGKVFKVLFIKINPITVLIRSSLRGLLSINFLGMATRFAVGMLSAKEAEALGYDQGAHYNSQQAFNKLKKLFTKMGGSASKLEKSIKAGANKKPLFKSDIRPDTKIKFSNGDDGETTLAEPATIAAMVAACAGIITTVWSWIKSIVATRQQKKEEEAAKQAAAEQAAYNAEHYELDAAGNVIVDQYGQPVPKGTIAADKAAAAAAQAAAPEGSNTKKILTAGAFAAAALLLLSSGKGGKRKNKRR